MRAHTSLYEGGAEGGARREVARYLNRFVKSSDHVSQGAPFDQEPGRKVRVQPSIFQPLHPSNGRRDRFVDNEKIVHVPMAGGLAGRMDDTPNHVQPSSRFQRLGLQVPITPAIQGPLRALRQIAACSRMCMLVGERPSLSLRYTLSM